MTWSKRSEIFIVLALLLLCLAAAFFIYRPGSSEHVVAVISVDSEEYLRIDLSKAEDELFSIEDATGKPVSFEVKDGKIRFVDVTCPDHLCEKSGWCYREGDRAVCLPNRTALICYSEP